MAASHEIVLVVTVEDTTIEVISCERGGTRFYFWRLIKDGKIVETNASLWDTSGEALDKAMERVLPDVGIRPIEEPTDDDFEMLNVLLGFDTPTGPVDSLFAALQWHNTLYEGMENLKKSAQKSEADWDHILMTIFRDQGETSDLYGSAVIMREIMRKQYEMSEHFANRDLDILRSFIDGFIKKGR